MTSDLRTVLLSDLVIDEMLYPRNSVDSVNCAHLVSSLRAGALLPPIVIDDKTMKIVDGVHRHSAYQTIAGKDYDTFTIEVLALSFKNDKERFAYAIEANASHGLRLSPLDIAHIIMLNRKYYKLKDATLATVLGITDAKLDGIIAQRFARNSDDPLKGIYRELAGLDITPDQKEANVRAGGFWRSLGLINQLNDALDANVIDLADRRVVQALERTARLVNVALSEAEMKEMIAE